MTVLPGENGCRPRFIVLFDYKITIMAIALQVDDLDSKQAGVKAWAANDA